MGDSNVGRPILAANPGRGPAFQRVQPPERRLRAGLPGRIARPTSGALGIANVRYAIRSLRKSPTLAGIAIASLAFGIGANLTVYSVVRELILDDVSARSLDRLVRVDANLTYAFYRDIRQAAPFEELAFDAGIHDANWQTGDHAEVAWVMDTSPNFFDVLGVGPQRRPSLFAGR